jgi:hypothetical protein
MIDNGSGVGMDRQAARLACPPRLHGNAKQQRSGAEIAADTDDDFVAAAPVRKCDGERAAQEASEVRIVPRGQLAQALYQGCFHMLREGGHVRGLDGRPRIIERNAMDGRQTICLGTPECAHVLASRAVAAKKTSLTRARAAHAGLEDTDANDGWIMYYGRYMDMTCTAHN